MPSTPIKSCNKYVLSYKDSTNKTHEVGFGGVYVLISSFDDDDDDDGEKYIYNLEQTYLA